MQGYLSMWTGVLSQWKRFYFILHNDILTFCSEKAGDKEGSIHLKIASVVSVIDDPLKINIHTGTHILFIRADSINLRIDWMKAITLAQQDIVNNDLSLQMRKLESDGARGYEAIDKKIKSLDTLIAELWNSQAEFEDLITQLIPRLQRNNASVRVCQKMIETTNNIKYKTSDALGIIEQIKVSYRQKPATGRQDISYASQKRKFTQNQDSVQNMLPALLRNNSNSLEQYRSFDRGYDIGLNRNISIDNYNSFERVPGGMSLQKINQISNQSQYMSFDRTQPPVSMKLLRKISQESNFSSYKEFDKNDGRKNKALKKKISPYSIDENCSNPFKNNLIASNIVFIEYPVANQSYRLSLPVSISPELKINIMSILKDSIGADLTKISLPVSLNQPLSVLQKGAQQMYYSQLLDQANQFPDPASRLLYVVAFVVSQYSLTINKTKKPFNPLLGQTYEYIDQKRKFRYLSQQVSHHPPISAMQCSSDNYQYFMNSKGSTNFRGASIKINPQSKSRIILKKNKDTIVFNKCTSSLNNLIVGTLYVDNYGQVIFKMCNSNQVIATANIQFSQSSMWGNTQYKVSGTVKDESGKQYKVDGRWNQSLSYTDPNVGLTKEIWTLSHKTLMQNYYFNELATNLNNLNTETLSAIAPTDSRLRPDQRALEYGNKQLAASEKQRLEQKQRQKRKIKQSKGEHHHPLWFEETLVKESGQKEWVSNSKYWEERKRQNWFNSEQIF